MLSSGMSPWSASACSVASGIVFTTSGATSRMTYQLSSWAGSLTLVDAKAGAGLAQDPPPVRGQDFLIALVGEPGVGDGGLAAQRRRLRGADLVQPLVHLGVHPRHENEATETIPDRSWPASRACSIPARNASITSSYRAREKISVTLMLIPSARQA